jgi:chaperonin GroEL
MMNEQQIEFGESGRKKLLKGVQTLSNAVKSTLGPGGRNCVFNLGAGTIVTKDGVTVAKQIRPNDPFEAMGADIIRQASERTAHIAGDGTSTSTLLAEAIATEGCKMLASGLNAISLQRGIMSAAKTIANYIKENIAEPCTTDKVKQVALVSTNWDEEISDLISEAVTKVGLNGSVTVNDSRTAESSVRYIDGLQIERGYMSPYFINNQAKQECIFENPLILLSGQKITNNVQLKPILEKSYNIGKGARPLLIIAPDIEQEALTTLVVNKLKGIFNVCAIKCPGFGDRMKEQMEDLEALLGGTYFTDILSREFISLVEPDYGSCDKVVITRDNTTFIHGHGSQEKLNNRINFLKTLLEGKPESWQARLYTERIAKLAEGVAVIDIGAATEVELRERRDRVDDAICATRAALEEGIVPGGGSVLAKVKNLDLNYETGDHSFNVGVDIVRKALTVPLKQLLINAGSECPDVIIQKVASSPINEGYDIKKEEFCDLMKSGIIDPMKVIRSVLENASSVAGLILTSECLVTEEKQDEE